jgi:tRNA-Thr(GGU) m(6)t(6)A37 methyltransferase TsaA
LRAEYAQALLGIKEGSQLYVLFGFDRAPEKSPLSQHPRGEATTPERGVFALRSPHRPNPLGLTLVKVTQVEDTALVVAGLDAWDGSPLYDLKPYVPELDR